MKLKSLIIILLSGLSLQIYCAPAPKKSEMPGDVSGSSFHESPAHEVPVSAKSESVQKTQSSNDSATPPKSSLKTSDTSATTNPKKSVSFGADTVSEFTSPETIEQKIDEGTDDYAAIDPHENLKIEDIPSDYKDNEEILKHSRFMNEESTATLATHEEFSKASPEEQAIYKSRVSDKLNGVRKNSKAKQKSQDLASQSVELAKKLEPQARAVKSDLDIETIVKQIDPNKVLSPEAVKVFVANARQWAMQESFNESIYQVWVESVNRIVNYLTGRESLTVKSSSKLKYALEKGVAGKSKAPLNAFEGENHSVKSKDLQPAIDKQTERLTEAQKQGDQSKVAQIEKNIANLKQIQEGRVQDKETAVTDQSNQLFDQESTVDASASTQRIHLCDSIEECISKMNDPADQASLSSLFKEIDRLSQDPNFANKYTQQQQNAIKYFIENGEKIINNTDNYVFYEVKTFLGTASVPTSNVMKITSEAGKLPKGKNSKALDQDLLISKRSENAQRVQAEQQQKSITATPANDLFTPTSATAVAA